MNVSRGSKIGLRTIALVYLFVLLVVPIGVILTRTFENAIGPFLESITTPAAISALNLSLVIVAIVTIPAAVMLGRYQARRTVWEAEIRDSERGAELQAEITGGKGDAIDAPARHVG